MQTDEEKFLTILKNNKGILFKVSNTYCNNKDDREDLIQEIIVQLWRAWPKFDHQYKVSTWMYRIALNVSISFYRKTSYRKEKHQQFSDSLNLKKESSESNTSEEIEQLHHFISKLNEMNKAIILLYLERYTYEEIGTSLGISTTNVATKISRIKKQLKSYFKKTNKDEFR